MKFVAKKLTATADNSTGNEGGRAFARNCALVAAAAWGLYLVLGWTADALATRIPDAWETDLLGLHTGADADPDDADLARCRQIFERLVQTPGLRKLHYRLVVVDPTDNILVGSTPNAFAAPGGVVGVTRSLLDQVDSEAGLAMVLGHELGHHQFRHTLTGLGRSILYRLTLALLLGDSGSEGVAEFSLGVAERSHSRDQESAADAFGLDLVRTTLGTTEGALDFFELVHREYEQGAPRWRVYFASHPLTTDRIEALRALQAAWRDKPAVPVVRREGDDGDR